jgi:CRP-like cAMP-binding protein
VNPHPPLHRLVLKSYAWFAGLPEAVRDAVLARGRRRQLARGQILYSRGEEPDGIYGVRDGCIRLSGISRDGHETVLDFYGPGVWFGEVSALSQLPRGHDAAAYAPTSVIHLPGPALEEMLAVSPVFSRACLQLEAMRVLLLLAALESYSTQSLEQRLAARLLMLAGPFGAARASGILIDLHLPQETLAQLTGMTRQRVNQILKAWQASGMINQDYGRILLRDRAAIETLAEM